MNQAGEDADLPGNAICRCLEQCFLSRQVSAPSQPLADPPGAAPPCIPVANRTSLRACASAPLAMETVKQSALSIMLCLCAIALPSCTSTSPCCCNTHNACKLVLHWSSQMVPAACICRACDARSACWLVWSRSEGNLGRPGRGRGGGLT